MAVFGNSIPRKRVLDARQLFSSSHVWNDRPSFHKKNRVKGHLVSTKFDLSSFISSKNEIKGDNSKRRKEDNFNLNRKRSFIDQ